MAPAAAHVRERLAELRAAGLTFDQAWPAATGAALASLAPGQAASWRAVLDAHEPDWRAGYDRAPAAGAAAALGSARELRQDDPRPPAPLLAAR